jgi:hypothetical protein
MFGALGAATAADGQSVEDHFRSILGDMLEFFNFFQPAACRSMCGWSCKEKPSPQGH